MYTCRFLIMKLSVHILISTLLLSLAIQITTGANGKNKAEIQEISDVKDWKKLIKSKTNVLMLFGNGRIGSSPNIFSVLQESADLIKGIGTVAIADCAGDGKKLCKKVKATPPSGQYILKHYHNGDFNKDYDRAEKVSSIVNFMKDPTGDLPWDEDPSATDVHHLADLQALQRLLKRESGSGRGILVMFYAPWCGFCKRMKPDYVDVAKELGDKALVAAMDVNRAENGIARQKYNITGFPTLLYFRNGELKQQYEGENNKKALVAFLRNPDAPPEEKPKETEWADEPSQVVHLTSQTFDEILQNNPSVLVMFYAPWCGHCKRMKPQYVTAAQRLLDENIPGKLAAVDATKEPSLGQKFGVKGYPTVKYFKDGALAFDADVRDEEAIVKFMKDPQEPPPPPPPEKPWSEEESAVVHLTEENFKPVLRKKKNALVMFYAPWCGHCKRAKPELAAAAEALKDDPKVLFGAVDCTEQQSLCKFYGVQGYPTFKKFTYLNKEPPKAYEGGRTKDDMMDEMKSTKPSVAKVNAKDWDGVPNQEFVTKLAESNYTSFLKSHGSVLVMFYAPWCGHCKSMKPDFALAAANVSKSGQGSLASCNCDENPKMVERYQLAGYPTLVFFKNGKPQGEYNHGRRASDIIEFMANKFRSNKDEL